jgi:hypothetical protein
MYILCLFEAVYISHDLSLEKKGLECIGRRFPLDNPATGRRIPLACTLRWAAAFR